MPTFSKGHTIKRLVLVFRIESIILAAGAASFIFVEDVYAPDEVNK